MADHDDLTCSGRAPREQVSRGQTVRHHEHTKRRRRGPMGTTAPTRVGMPPLAPTPKR